jgi:hypothetical protein
VSTIKVDTYLTRGGASEIAIDKLKGASSAGSMTVVAEGGTNTTNLQQGLCKFFSNIDGDAGTISTRDSFNQSGITDNGSGDYTFAFTNNMANDDYSHMTNADSASGHLALQYGESQDNTNNCRAYVIEAYSNGATDSNVVMNSINGDLA